MKMNQRRREIAVAAARQVAPIANWVKPSRVPVTLPELGLSPYQRNADLEALLAQERAEKFQLQNLVASLSKRLDRAMDKIREFARDEQ